MRKHLILMTVAATLKQKNLIIQWNNLLIYKYCVIRFPDLRN